MSISRGARTTAGGCGERRTTSGNLTAQAAAMGAGPSTPMTTGRKSSIADTTMALTDLKDTLRITRKKQPHEVIAETLE